jgi:hypothetical protein
VLAALVAALLPSTASARVISDTTIVLGRAIGDGVVGKSRANLERKLGAGKVLRRFTNDFGTFTTVRYADKDIDVKYLGNSSVEVTTKDGRYGTVKGLGVGARKADLRRAYPSIKCSGRICTIGRQVGGARVTDFRLTRQGAVMSVTVGVIVD